MLGVEEAGGGRRLWRPDSAVDLDGALGGQEGLKQLCVLTTQSEIRFGLDK